MNLIHTTIGELYNSLSTLEIKQLDNYIRANGSGKTYDLHALMVKLVKQNNLVDKDYEFVKKKLYKSTPINHSSFTTIVNLLITEVKEYLLMTKIKEKNIYTETLWGEIMIERGLKRNLLLKLSQFKVNLTKDQYPVHKIYFHKRELKFYSFFKITRKSILNILSSILEEIYTIHELSLFIRLELLISFVTNHKLIGDKITDEHKKLIDDSIIEGINSKNLLININALLLNLIIKKEEASYLELRHKFLNMFNSMSHELRSQIFSILINFGLDKVVEGESKYWVENYNLLKFLNEKKQLFSREYFTLTRFNMYISYELSFGSIEIAKDMLETHIGLIQLNQRDSFYNLNSSKIKFAKGNYKDALMFASQINPSDSLFFYPQYKTMLIKCYIMLESISRLDAERDNFYKYIANNANTIPEDAQARHKLFIRYADYMTEAKFEFLQGYMRKRIETALLQTSPYFTEKEWMRERWNELKAKYDKKDDEE